MISTQNSLGTVWIYGLKFASSSANSDSETTGIVVTVIPVIMHAA